MAAHWLPAFPLPLPVGRGQGGGEAEAETAIFITERESSGGGGEGTAWSLDAGPGCHPWPHLDPCLEPCPPSAMAPPPLSWLFRLAALCHLTMLLAGERVEGGQGQGGGDPGPTSPPQA